MRLPGRRSHEHLPDDIARALPLRRGESALAGARDEQGRWYVGTALALLVPEGESWRRLPWETIARATWDRDSEQLVVVETAEFGEPEPTHRAALEEPERMLQLIRERVTASVVVQVFEPVDGKRGITVSGRRAPHTDHELLWSVQVDPGLDETSTVVREAMERAVAAAQSEIGM